MIILTLLLFTSCEKDPVVLPPSETLTITGEITTNQTWIANNDYLLSGFVYVKNNATLTIEAGTIIKGVSGTKATLVIEKGSKIVAKGTNDKPIVFTSDKPVGQRSYGDWGGLVICGNALTNKHDNGAGNGIAEGGIGAQYGGTDPNDNSGTLQYVRIEFPGIPLTATANSEINGLTLYGVGKGTTIDHIQVSFSGDDSFEWFGGNVDAKYIIAYKGWDDDFDSDNGYSGNVQYFYGVRDPNAADQSGSNGFESDNDADGSQLTPITTATFSDGLLVGPLATSTTINALYKHAVQIRRGSRISIYRTVFSGFPYGIYIDGQKGDSPAQALAGTLKMETNTISKMTTNFVTTYMPTIETWYLSKNIINDNYQFTVPNWVDSWCNFNPQNTEY